MAKLSDKLKQVTSSGQHTATDIAVKSGVSRMMVYHYMNEKYKPSHETYCRLCRAINLDPAEQTKEEDYYQ